MIARLSERFEMYGNGCAGSTASGVSTGKMSSSNTASRWLRSAPSRSSQLDEADAGLLERGRDLLREHRGLAGHELVDPARGSRAAARRWSRPSGDVMRSPESIWSFSAETRTWKNSSRFCEKIARNFARSSSGQRGIFREREDAGVEVEPRELAVEVASVGLDGVAHDRVSEAHQALIVRERRLACAPSVGRPDPWEAGRAAAAGCGPGRRGVVDSGPARRWTGLRLRGAGQLDAASMHGRAAT